MVGYLYLTLFLIAIYFVIQSIIHTAYGRGLNDGVSKTLHLIQAAGLWEEFKAKGETLGFLQKTPEREK